VVYNVFEIDKNATQPEMIMSYETMTTDQLGSYFSDFYKEIHCVRPRHVDFSDREALIHGIESLESYFDSMKSTREGRDILRAEGWVFPEEEPEVPFVPAAYNPPKFADVFAL
jgi:hypothetical protein